LRAGCGPFENGHQKNMKPWWTLQSCGGQSSPQNEHTTTNPPF
jgi:hypothetical protein